MILVAIIIHCYGLLIFVVTPHTFTNSKEKHRNYIVQQTVAFYNMEIYIISYPSPYIKMLHYYHPILIASKFQPLKNIRLGPQIKISPLKSNMGYKTAIYIAENHHEIFNDSAIQTSACNGSSVFKPVLLSHWQEICFHLFGREGEKFSAEFKCVVMRCHLGEACARLIDRKSHPLGAPLILFASN